jgi:hypothetical protein
LFVVVLFGLGGFGGFVWFEAFFCGLGGLGLLVAVSWVWCFVGLVAICF